MNLNLHVIFVLHHHLVQLQQNQPVIQLNMQQKIRQIIIINVNEVQQEIEIQQLNLKYRWIMYHLKHLINLHAHDEKILIMYKKVHFIHQKFNVEVVIMMNQLV